MTHALNKRKIINDPVHGIISVPGEFIYDLIENPFFQRLRNIRQLGLTEYVYPGASHSRFIHSLGALHLMNLALETLMQKGISISREEHEAALIAILLHDTGHGPFSHALEFKLVENISHEKLSLLVMKLLNEEYGDRITAAIEMFSGQYHRQFFHDLISSQIDMDRLDYLVRDSFFTGVIEGAVGSDRIIKMLNVNDDRLVVDAKGIYSIENFLIARRLMYWQVYMHKTVLSAERLLINIIARARELTRAGDELLATPVIKYFLDNDFSDISIDKPDDKSHRLAEMFLALDDNEMISSVRLWSGCKDRILAELSSRMLSRRLFAIELGNEPFEESRIDELKKLTGQTMNIGAEDLRYFVFSGAVSNMTYAPSAPVVRIMDKSGRLSPITEVSDMLNHKALSKEVTKFFLCYPKEIRNKDK